MLVIGHETGSKIRWEVGNEVDLPLPLYYFTCVAASSVQPETLVSISFLGHLFYLSTSNYGGII